MDSDGYLLTCRRYIELNPVRAAMAAWPREHRWSSVHFHLGLRPRSRVTPHPVYLALGYGDARTDIYRALLLQPLDDEVLATVRDHICQERALGSPRLQEMVARTLNRPAAVRRPRRPPLARISNAPVL